MTDKAVQPVKRKRKPKTEDKVKKDVTKVETTKSVKEQAETPFKRPLVVHHHVQ